MSIKDMIPKDHICFLVEEFTDNLDYTKFDMQYDGAGHPAYPPRIIMKIIIQGMLSRIRSSRKLATACRENFVMMYLAEKAQPDFRTIARFRKDTKVRVDCGYSDGENIKFAEDNNIDLYVPSRAQAQEFDDKEQSLNHDKYEYDWKKNELIVGNFRERLRMRDKMATEDGKKVYSLRKSTAEPVIGNIKQNLGFREFLLRGLDKVKIEMNIACIAHNLQKIWRMAAAKGC